MDAGEVPTSMMVDASQYVKDLVLLTRLVKDRSCNGKRTDRHRSNAVVFGVRHNTADLMRMMQLDRPCLVVVVVRGLEGVDLCEQTHRCVVKEPTYNGGAFDEPVLISIRLTMMPSPNESEECGRGRGKFLNVKTSLRDSKAYQTLGNADLVNDATR